MTVVLYNAIVFIQDAEGVWTILDSGDALTMFARYRVGPIPGRLILAEFDATGTCMTFMERLL